MDLEFEIGELAKNVVRSTIYGGKEGREAQGWANYGRASQNRGIEPSPVLLCFLLLPHQLGSAPDATTSLTRGLNLFRNFLDLEMFASW